MKITTLSLVFFSCIRPVASWSPHVALPRSLCLKSKVVQDINGDDSSVEALDQVEPSGFDEWLIKVGFKQDERVRKSFSANMCLSWDPDQ